MIIPRIYKIAFMIFGIVFIMGMGCEIGGSGLDLFADLFSDTPTSPVKIVNKTGVDIVLFKGSLIDDDEHLLGGVTAGKTFGIRRVDGFYLIKAITKDDYSTYRGGDLSQAKVIDVALVFIIGDQWTTNEFYGANKAAGGYVSFRNDSVNYVQIQNESWYGDVFTILSPGEERNQYLVAGEYDFFPSRITAQSNSGSLVAFKKTWLKDNYGSFNVDDVGSAGTFIINPSWETEVKSSYLYVKNSTSNGVRLIKGSEILKSTTHREIVNGAGGIQAYEFNPNPSILLTSMEFRDAMGYPVATVSTDITLTNGQSYYLVINSDNSLSYDQPAF